jgi:bacterioferritin
VSSAHHTNSERGVALSSNTNFHQIARETMDRSKTVDKLNEILRHEWTGVAQYAQAGFLVSGVWREVYSGMFFASAEESFGHAKKVGEKIVALGGVPTIERNAVKQTGDLGELLRNALEFERAAVKHYEEALALADGTDRPLVVFLEDILIEEQEGAEHVEKLLREQKQVPASSTKGASKAV